MTINEVSEKTGLSIFTLRYYEKQGLIPNVNRDSSGHRNYTDGNLKMIEFIKKMKATGMPLKEICSYILLTKEGKDSYTKRLEILEKHKKNMEAQIHEAQEFYNYITHKITWYKKNSSKGANKSTSKK